MYDGSGDISAVTLKRNEIFLTLYLVLLFVLFLHD